MIVHCPTCRRVYDFPVELIAEPPFIATCAGCETPFALGPTGNLDALRGDVPSEFPLAESHPPDQAQGEPPAPPAPPLEGDDGGEYLIVRGVPRRRVEHERRVLVVARQSAVGARPARPCRIVAHRPGFPGVERGRTAPGDGVTEVAAPLDDDRTSTPAAPPRPSETRQLLAAVAVAGLVAGLIGLGWALGGKTEAPAVTRAAAVAAPSPRAPGTDEAAPRQVADNPEPLLSGSLTTELTSVDALPALRAVVVYGQLANGTPGTVADVEIEVVITDRGMPVRRRLIYCCDDPAPAELPAIADDAAHRHYARTPRAAALGHLASGDRLPFTVVFPQLDSTRLAGPIAAEFTILGSVALPATESGGAGGAAGAGESAGAEAEIAAPGPAVGVR